jgi:hypothetical protein
LFGLENHALAANHYVRADAAGTRTGADWTNAYTVLPATLVRGDVYYIADGNYAVQVAHPEWGECVHTFKDTEDGTRYITIRKAIAADHGTDLGWQAGYGDGTALFTSGNASAIFAFTKSYYIIDGQIGGGPDEWRTGFGITLSYTGTVVTLHGQSNWQQDLPHHIEFRHVEFIGGLDSLPYDSNGIATTQPSDILWAIGPDSGYEGPENIYIGYCYLHDAQRMMINASRMNYWTMEYNYFARNHSDAVYHGEAIQAQGGRHGVFRYSIMEDIEGTCFIAIKKNSDQDHDDWKFYGNVFFHTVGSPCSVGGNGVIGVSGGSTTIHSMTSHISVYNNTFCNILGLNVGIYLYEDGDGPLDSNYVHNNVWYNCTGRALSFTGVTGHDNNWFYGNIDDRFAAGHPGRNLDSITLATHPEANGVIGTAAPCPDWQNGDFRLTAAIPGLALDTVFGMDWYGNLRGGDGVWDRGALEYVSTGITNDELQTAKCELQQGIQHPNPMKISDMTRLTGVRFYDLQGRPVRPEQTDQNGIVLIMNSSGNLHKITLVK